ncbi:MAG: acyl carrier protein [Planctomycetaceae bacterium]|nr:acyl carrier protein [Planctomycetaceae bacterium]
MDATAFLVALDELFELDRGTITSADAIRDIPGWSSLTFMGLIALVDDELDITLTPDTVLACRTVGDLLQEVGLATHPARQRAA